jgi:hypothetical protein
MKVLTSKNPHLYFLDEPSISIQTKITGHHVKAELMELTFDGLLTLWKGYQCNQGRDFTE